MTSKSDPERPWRKAMKPLSWMADDDDGPAWHEPIHSDKQRLDEYERHRPHRGATDADMESRLEARNRRRIQYHIQRGAQLSG